MHRVAFWVAVSMMIGLMACQTMTSKPMEQAMSDASISAAVQTKLTTDRILNFTRMDVDTERGTVQLSGIVSSAEQKARAEYLTRQVNGVKRVANNLQIHDQSDQDR